MLDIGTLFRVQSSHVDVWMLAYEALLVLQTSLLKEFAARLLEYIVNLILDGLIDLILSGEVFRQTGVALTNIVHF